MKQVSLYEAKTHLSKLVDEAAAGEEIVIAKNGKPKAKLMPIGVAVKKEPRKLGQWAEANKNFDWEKWDRESKALDKEIEADFEASIARPLPGFSESGQPLEMGRVARPKNKRKPKSRSRR